MSDLIRAEIMLWEHVDSRLRTSDELPLSFFETLHFVARDPAGSLRIGDLAQALHVTVGGTSKLVDRIEAAGLIARGPDPDDRRAARVTLTAAGRRALEAARATYDTAAAEFLDPVLRSDEQRQLHDYLARLLNAAQERASR